MEGLTTGFTPLTTATYEGHLDVVKFLVQNGADINHKDKKFGKNVLHNAKMNAHHEVVEFLEGYKLLLIQERMSWGCGNELQLL